MKIPAAHRHIAPSLFIVLVASTLMMQVAGCSSGSGDAGRQVIAFQQINVIDAVDGLRTEQSVVVRDDRIAEVGPSEQVSIPDEADVVDGSGLYLLPGFWDAHVHMTNTPSMQSALFPLLIANGITYVRDTGAVLSDLRPILQEGVGAAQQGMAPDIYYVGPHIDGQQLIWESSVSAATVGRGRSIVDSLIQAGVDEIKVYELIAPEVFSEVASRARDQDYNITAHVPLSMDVVEASDAGLTAMEHLQNLEFSCSSEWESLLEQRKQLIEEGEHLEGNELRWKIQGAQRTRAIETLDEERCSQVLGTLARNQTWQVPTLTYTAMAEHSLVTSDEWRETFRYLPEPVRLDWLERAQEQALSPTTEDELAQADWARQMIPRLAEADIGIMAGTDMPLFLLTPGFSLHRELALLVEAGLSSLQAIEAATLAPAQYYGLEESQGSIAEGMKADLLLLNANPLQMISNTQHIHAVMRNGHLHSRQDLDAMLEQLEERGRLEEDRSRYR